MNCPVQNITCVEIERFDPDWHLLSILADLEERLQSLKLENLDLKRELALVHKFLLKS